MKLHATVLGEGIPFLILHGFLGMGDNWKTLGRKFSELGYQVHLIDQRNHGRSPHSEEFTYDAMARDLKEYCDDHSLKNCVFLGHSMGGKTVMYAASMFPELVEKLIVVDIAPRYYRPHHQQILAGLKALNETELTSRSQAEELLSTFVEEEGTRLFLLKNLYWKSKGKLDLRLNLKVVSEKVDEIGEAFNPDASFSKLSLFIKGGASNYISEEDKPQIEKHFPKAKIHSIPNAGHWVHAEKQEEFYTAVVEFLELS